MKRNEKNAERVKIIEKIFGESSQYALPSPPEVHGKTVPLSEVQKLFPNIAELFPAIVYVRGLWEAKKHPWLPDGTFLYQTKYETYIVTIKTDEREDEEV